MNHCQELSYPKVSFQNTSCDQQKIKKIYFQQNRKVESSLPKMRKSSKFQTSSSTKKQFIIKYKKDDYKFVPSLEKNKKFSLDSCIYDQKYKQSQILSKAQNQQNQKSQTNCAKNLKTANSPTQLGQAIIINHNKQQKNSFCQVIQELKMLVPSKNDKNYTKFDLLIQKLKIINPFFSKLPNGSTYLLLKIGKVIIIQKQKTIYQIDSTSNFFYIILYGKVCLKDSNIGFVKYSKTGQVLSEQQIFTNQAQHRVKIRDQSIQKHRQTATTQIETCLLRINKKKYYELQHQMYEKGNVCKTLFTQINNSLKVQYLSKQMNRNQAIDKRNKKCIRRYYTEFDI